MSPTAQTPHARARHREEVAIPRGLRSIGDQRAVPTVVVDELMLWVLASLGAQERARVDGPRKRVCGFLSSFAWSAATWTKRFARRRQPRLEVARGRESVEGSRHANEIF